MFSKIIVVIGLCVYFTFYTYLFYNLIKEFMGSYLRWLEYGTHNALVTGSNPVEPTTILENIMNVLGTIKFLKQVGISEEIYLEPDCGITFTRGQSQEEYNNCTVPIGSDGESIQIKKLSDSLNMYYIYTFYGNLFGYEGDIFDIMFYFNQIINKQKVVQGIITLIEDDTGDTFSYHYNKDHNLFLPLVVGD